MPDMLRIGASGVLAYQRSLATVSHNIANANTEGYNRQRVETTPGILELSPQGVLGSGVTTDTTQRYYDEFLTNQLRNSTSSFNKVDSYYQFSSQIDNLLGDPDVGLSPAVMSFFDAVQEVAKDPTSIPARQVLVTESQVLTTRFQDIDNRLSEYQQHINDQVTNDVTEINSIAQSIATLNGQIVTATSRASGQPPNDLLDKREQLIQQLSEYTKVNVVKQDNGYLNVFIGNGQALVLDQIAVNIDIRQNEYDSQRLELYSTYEAGNSIRVTDTMSGGKLGGLLDFQNQILDPSRLALGQIAVGLTKTFNDQHTTGIDLNGQWGKAFFNTLTPDVLSSNQNQGSSSVSAVIKDVSKLHASDYVVKFEGAVDTDWLNPQNWSVKRKSDGKAVDILSGTGETSTPFATADGFSFTVNSGEYGPSIGDSFLVRPAYGLSGQVESKLNDPLDVAASAALRSEAALTNLGSGTIAPPSVVDTQNPNIKDSVRLTFDDASTFSVADVYGSQEGSFQAIISVDPEHQAEAYSAATANSDASGNPIPYNYQVTYLGPTQGYQVSRDGVVITTSRGPTIKLGTYDGDTFYSDGFLLNLEGKQPLATDKIDNITAPSVMDITANPDNTGSVSITAGPVGNDPLPPLQFHFTSPTTLNIVNLATNEVVKQDVDYTDGYIYIDYPNSDNASWYFSLEGQAQTGDSFVVRGKNQQSYQPNQSISYNGWQTTLGGSPQAGDYFSLEYNTGGLSDNRNALALAEIQSQDLLAGKTTDLVSAYGQLVADVGRKTSEAQINQNAQQGLLNFIKDERDSYSAVNLDEEAADLIYYQQNYQAAAQIVSKADAIFQTLLKAIGG